MNVNESRQSHDPPRRDAVDKRLRVQPPPRLAQRLHQHFRALDVRDERHAVVHRHPPGSIPVRRHKRRHTSGAADAHRQIDHQVEMLVGQIVGHAHHLAGHLVDADVVADALEDPLDGLDGDAVLAIEVASAAAAVQDVAHLVQLAHASQHLHLVLVAAHRQQDVLLRHREASADHRLQAGLPIKNPPKKTHPKNPPKKTQKTPT